MTEDTREVTPDAVDEADMDEVEDDIQREPTQSVSAQNEAAGNYNVTREPRAQEAAQRAIGAIYAEFPYYEERYGERGRAFSTTDSGWLVTLPRMGALLATAVADERDGVANSVDSLLAWAGDPERFSQAWIDAVNETLAQARAHS